jgi:fimbrial chaperone protein
MRSTSFRRRLKLANIAAAVLVASLVGNASAAEFSVTPIRVDLKPGTLTETITVANDATATLRVSMKLMAWSQDARGEDVYSEASDLVYFPRQMEIAPGARRLVRIGVKTILSGPERTYRLFIEEVPVPDASGGTGVNFFFRFGVPVFVTPATTKAEVTVGEAALTKGKLVVPVQNNGNRHYRFNRIVFSNGSTFVREIAGWYSLPATQRTYSIDVPLAACRASDAFTVQLQGDGMNLERSVKVDPANCD